jgi:hypothetical protein
MTDTIDEIINHYFVGYSLPPNESYIRESKTRLERLVLEARIDEAQKVEHRLLSKYVIEAKLTIEMDKRIAELQQQLGDIAHSVYVGFNKSHCDCGVGKDHTQHSNAMV